MHLTRQLFFSRWTIRADLARNLFFAVTWLSQCSKPTISARLTNRPPTLEDLSIRDFSARARAVHLAKASTRPHFVSLCAARRIFARNLCSSANCSLHSSKQRSMHPLRRRSNFRFILAFTALQIFFSCTISFQRCSTGLPTDPTILTVCSIILLHTVCSFFLPALCSCQQANARA